MLIAEEVRHSNQSHGVYWITYLHRTAREFLGKPQNWSWITRATLKSGFDSYVAILMASLVKLKTQLAAIVYGTSVTFLKIIMDLKMTPSDSLTQVIEKYDRVLNVRWEEHGGTQTNASKVIQFGNTLSNKSTLTKTFCSRSPSWTVG
jgi:hypothetical protein